MTVKEERHIHLGDMSRDDFGTFDVTLRSLLKDEPYPCEIIMTDGTHRMSVLVSGETCRALAAMLTDIAGDSE